MWRSAASTVSRSSSGNSRPASHWRPLTPNRSEHGGLPCSRRCSTAWISFLARVRHGRAARGARAGGAASGSAHPASTPPRARPSTTASPASGRPAGRSSRAPADPGVIRADHDHPLHMRLEIRATSHAAASYLQRDAVGRQKTLRQRLDRLRRARHPACRRTLPVLADRDHAEVTVNIQADRAPTQLSNRHISPPHSSTTAGEPRENDTDRYELEAQSRQVAGAAERISPGSKPIATPAYPTAFSTRIPCPGAR